jgi:hypothetical protein
MPAPSTTIEPPWRPRLQNPDREMVDPAREIDRELERLTMAVAQGASSLTSLLEGISEREARRAARVAALRSATPEPRLSFDETAAALRNRLNDWRAMLADAPDPARRILRTLLSGRIILRPDHATGQCSFTGRANLREAFAGLLQPMSFLSDR